MLDKYEALQGYGSASAMVKGRFYQVGSGATTASIPILSTSGLTMLLSPSAQSQLVNSRLVIADTINSPTTAPTLTTATTGGSLAAATYYVVYTWVDVNGETKASPEANITTTGSASTVTVTLPSFPNGVTSANVYISTTSGAETKQGNTTSTSYTQSAALASGSALPSSNTTGTLVEEAVVTAVSSSGTLSLDGALSAAPAQGSPLLLIPPEQTQLTGSNIPNPSLLAINSSSNIDIAASVTYLTPTYSTNGYGRSVSCSWEATGTAPNFNVIVGSAEMSSLSDGPSTILITGSTGNGGKTVAIPPTGTYSFTEVYNANTTNVLTLTQLSTRYEG